MPWIWFGSLWPGCSEIDMTVFGMWCKNEYRIAFRLSPECCVIVMWLTRQQWWNCGFSWCDHCVIVERLLDCWIERHTARQLQNDHSSTLLLSSSSCICLYWVLIFHCLVLNKVFCFVSLSLFFIQSHDALLIYILDQRNVAGKAIRGSDYS